MLIETLLGAYFRRATKAHLKFGAESSAAETPAPAPGRKYLLYIHIPFCESLCPFCSFHRVQLRRDKAARYFRALRKEIELYHAAGFDFVSAYVGGGTPTVMPEELVETLELMRSLFSIKEISVETNPNHLRPEVLSLLKVAQVNRLSVGVQSFDDELLKEMRRYGPYGSSAEIVSRLEDVQGVFDTLNIDMIFNLPHQGLESLQRDIQILKTLEVDQVSFYPLMPATTTRRAMAHEMGAVTFRREKAFYQELVEVMSEAYRPSSAWCFSRGTGMIDEYIVDYDEYLGVGSGSFSYLGGSIYSSTFSIPRYLHRVESGRTGITLSRRFERIEQMRYDFLMKLFGLELDVEGMERKYGGEFQRRLWKEFLFFRILGALKASARQYRLTKRGMYYWVVMMREFLMGVNNFREDMRRHIRAEYGAEVAANLERNARSTTAPEAGTG